MSTRRTALQSIVAAGVALPAAAQHQPSDGPIGIAGLYVPKSLDATQMKTVATLVDLIIPRGWAEAALPARRGRGPRDSRLNT